METLTIDLKKKKSFEIGQQGDHNALCIHFINMKNVGTNKKYIYYTIDGIENCVPLTNDRFIVGYPLTAHSGIASAQLISKLNDNTIIKLSNVFAMHIKESKGYKDSGEYPVDPNIQSSYDLLDDLIDQTQDLINNYNYATLMEKLTQASSEATTSATTAKKCADELKSSTDFINTLDEKVAAQDSKIEKIEASTSHITTKQNTKIDVFKSEVNTRLSNQTASINQSTTEQNSKITTLESRMDTFTSLKEGSTTGDAELIDARIGADGTKYASAGDAMRGQVEQVNKALGKYFEYYDYRDSSKTFDFNTAYHDNRITFINSNTNILNAPFDEVKDGSTWIVLNFYDKDLPRFITQNVLKTVDVNNLHGTRLYYNDNWLDWSVSITGQNVNDLRGTGKSFDFNTVKKENVQTFVNISNTVLNAPYELTSGTWLITNYYDYNNPLFITQIVRNIEIPNEDKQAYRVYLLQHDKWVDWEISGSIDTQNKIFKCGPNQEYTTLRSAIESAIQVKNATVIVYPATYDLSVEFKDVLDSKNGTGIKLDNGVHVKFMGGSFVKANLELDSWSLTNFEPFKAVGDFTLEGLNIECTNTRYCVHDEHSDTEQTYINKYINCNMTYHPNGQKTYVQCIGGGLGRNGYIDIVGGKYTTVIDDVNYDIPISYHNNGTYNDAYSVINVSNVYLANKGYIRFGNHGPSTLKTNVNVNNCSFGAGIQHIMETDSDTIDNFEILEFNNSIR